MEIPDFVKAMVIRSMIRFVPGFLDDIQDKQIPHLDAAALSLWEGGSLRAAVKAYVESTEDVGDDAIVEKVDAILDTVTKYLNGFTEALASSDQPFLEVVDKYLTKIRIPDYDSDPSNDVTVAEVIRSVVKAMAEA